MKRRVAIASALAQKPAVLLLDEALVGLDPLQRMDVIGVLRKTAETLPVIITTHVLSDILELEGSVACMQEGTLSDAVSLSSLSPTGATPTLDELTQWYSATLGGNYA